MLPPPPGATLFPYTTLFRSEQSRYREINAKKTLNRGQHRCRCKRIAAKSKKIARCFDTVVSENIFPDSDKLQRKRIARHGWGMRFVFYSPLRFVRKRDAIDLAIGKKRQLRKAENTLRQ